MTSDTSLVGASENETLKKESAWISGWADIMMTDLRTAYSIISNVVAAYGIKGDNKPHDDRVSLDGMTCMLVGLMNRLDNDFHFRVAKADEKTLIPWKSISAGIKSIYNQSRKLEQIPVDRLACKEVLSSIPIDDAARMAISEFVKNIILNSNRIQSIINTYYTPKTQEDAHYLKVQLDIVDREGNIVALKDLNIEQIVNAQITKIFDEAKKAKEEADKNKTASEIADKINLKQDLKGKKKK